MLKSTEGVCKHWASSKSIIHDQTIDLHIVCLNACFRIEQQINTLNCLGAHLLRARDHRPNLHKPTLCMGEAEKKNRRNSIDRHMRVICFLLLFMPRISCITVQAHTYTIDACHIIRLLNDLCPNWCVFNPWIIYYTAHFNRRCY